MESRGADVVAVYAIHEDTQLVTISTFRLVNLDLSDVCFLVPLANIREDTAEAVFLSAEATSMIFQKAAESVSGGFFPDEEFG